MPSTFETRILGHEPLLAPAALLDELPLDELPLARAAAATAERTRAEVRSVLASSDDRLLVITGPCPVHDPAAASGYAARLADLRDQYAADLLIVMPFGAAPVAATAGNTDARDLARRPFRPELLAARRGQGPGSDRVGLPRRVMVDASHGNSGKDYRRQSVVARPAWPSRSRPASAA